MAVATKQTEMSYLRDSQMSYIMAEGGIFQHLLWTGDI